MILVTSVWVCEGARAHVYTLSYVHMLAGASTHWTDRYSTAHARVWVWRTGIGTKRYSNSACTHQKQTEGGKVAGFAGSKSPSNHSPGTKSSIRFVILLLRM